MKLQINSQFFRIFLFVFFVFLFNSCKEQSDKEEVVITEDETEANVEPFFKLSLAQWSVHNMIWQNKLNPMDFAQKASEMGFSGVEYVSQLYTEQIDELGMQTVLDTLLARSEANAIENLIIMVDNEGDLADPSVDKRDEAVEKHKKWVDAAEFLGCHSIRVNTFGTNEAGEWHDAVVDGLRKLSEYAAKKDVNVLVENHGWLSSDPEKVMAALDEVDMENCGTLPDFGNFCIKRKDGERWGQCVEEYPDIYKGIELMMPRAKAVSAKSYEFDGDGNETKLDYPRLLKIVKESGYTGHIGVEFEGEELDEEQGILATKDLLLKSAAELAQD